MHALFCVEAHMPVEGHYVGKTSELSLSLFDLIIYLLIFFLVCAINFSERDQFQCVFFRVRDRFQCVDRFQVFFFSVCDELRD